MQPLCTQPTATILDSDVTSEEKGSRGIRRVLLKGGTLVCEASARDPYKYKREQDIYMANGERSSYVCIIGALEGEGGEKWGLSNN